MEACGKFPGPDDEYVCNRLQKLSGLTASGIAVGWTEQKYGPRLSMGAAPQKMQIQSGCPRGPIREERKMKKFFLVLLALAAALAISPVASAQNYDFTYINGSDISASGWLVTGAADGSGYDVTNGGLTFGTDTLSLLAITTPGGVSFYSAPWPGYIGFNYDNILFPSGGQGAYLDTYGLLFGNSTEVINIWCNGGVWHDAFYQWENGALVKSEDNGNFGLTAPEYSGLSTFLLCALTLAGGLFFKARQTGLFLNS
jgi:hypothetical protein